MNMRDKHLSIQIVVGESIGEGGAVSAERGVESSRRLRCHRTRRFVNAPKGAGEGVPVIIRCRHGHRAECKNTKSCQKQFFLTISPVGQFFLTLKTCPSCTPPN